MVVSPSLASPSCSLIVPYSDPTERSCHPSVVQLFICPLPIQFNSTHLDSNTLLPTQFNSTVHNSIQLSLAQSHSTDELVLQPSTGWYNTSTRDSPISDTMGKEECRRIAFGSSVHHPKVTVFHVNEQAAQLVARHPTSSRPHFSLKLSLFSLTTLSFKTLSLESCSRSLSSAPFSSSPLVCYFSCLVVIVASSDLCTGKAPNRRFFCGILV